MKKIICIPIFSFLLGTFTFAQEGLGTEEFYRAEHSYNPNSVHPIHNSDIMWKKRLVRAMDLREKQNEPLMARNNEITKMIIEAVKEGKIKPYTSDSLQYGNSLTLDEFMSKLIIPGTNDLVDTSLSAYTDIDEDPEFDPWEPDFVVDNSSVDSQVDLDEQTDTPMGPEYYGATDLYQLELTEDLIFDKQRSQMRYDIQAITVFIPADHPMNMKGIQEPLASFSYKELVEKVFAKDPNAIWFNPYNDSEHRSLADAFDLRLFSSYIIKTSNPADDYLVDIHGSDEAGISASQWTQYQLLEYEHNLWEF